MVLSNFREHLSHTTGSDTWSLSSAQWSESIFKLFNLQKSLSLGSGFIECILDQRKWQFLVLDKHTDSTSLLGLLFLESSSVVFELLLVDHSDITKPSTIWLNLTGVGIGWRFFQLHHIGLCFVHINSVNGSFSTELGSSLAARWVGPVGVGRGFRPTEGRTFSRSDGRLGCHELFIVRFTSYSRVTTCFFRHF